MSTTSSDTTITSVPAPSVALPHRATPDNSRPPIWSINTAVGNELPPLQNKCAKHHNDNGVCCRDLKGDDDRTLIDPDVVRDVVIGLSDGLTVPFALTAGLSSLGESKLVILGGVAELIAGAISMGIGGFLASQAERDHSRFLRKQTAARVQRSCAGEMEREVLAVLGPVGVDEKAARMVAQSLRKAENNSAYDDAPADEETGLLRWQKGVGLTAFLMKFGEGMEDVPTRRLYISAFTIGMGYFVGGLIPLMPYFFIPVAYTALIYSAILTCIILLIFGGVKARVTGAAGKGAWGYVWGAVSTMLVGGAAAGAAFAIVKVLED
ncbi:hypothetical protein PLICRDRAFT_517057 [Plicaturopsis crispa FD-325 SS-3]|nr:hypothetical protein PLICRDRAFT_517057 [Plicaturopsis crispa FD-325 SS-3]